MRARAHIMAGRPSRTMIAVALYGLMVLIGVAVPTSYIVQSPGPVLDVTGEIDDKEILTVSGIETYESDTDFLMTTVTATGNAENGVPGIAAVGALATRNLQLVPVRTLYPAQVSSAEIRERNLTLMNFSQDTAAAVAFETAGLEVSMQLNIAGVPEDSPAYGFLEEGDVIKAISSPVQITTDDWSAGWSDEETSAQITNAEGTDGFVTVSTFMDLSGVLDATPPGTKIDLAIERDGKEQTVTVPTKAFEPDPTGWVHPGSLLGVFVEVTNVELPADVEYVIDGIGGPSAGGMFTLAIYDAIADGSLGGDTTIAGTGAIAWDGEIEPIGGIRHKINGARDAGATDFIAPAINCPETVGYEPDGLDIWAVRTIADAIGVVEAIEAGDTTHLTPCSALEAVEPIEAS